MRSDSIFFQTFPSFSVLYGTKLNFTFLLSVRLLRTKFNHSPEFSEPHLVVSSGFYEQFDRTRSVYNSDYTNVKLLWITTAFVFNTDNRTYQKCQTGVGCISNWNMKLVVSEKKSIFMTNNELAFVHHLQFILLQVALCNRDWIEIFRIFKLLKNLYKTINTMHTLWSKIDGHTVQQTWIFMNVPSRNCHHVRQSDYLWHYKGKIIVLSTM